MAGRSPGPRAKSGAGGELFGPMAEYQHALTETEHWPHLTENGSTEVIRIADMAPAHAVNALHRLYRWKEFLYTKSTEDAYDKASTKLFESPLASALIQQALGPFYVGTFLDVKISTVAHPPEEMPPHIDDLSTPLVASIAEDLRTFEDQVLECGITIASTLDQMGQRRESIGRRAMVARDIILSTLKEEPT